MNFVVNNYQMKLAEKNCDEKHISFSEMMNNAGKAAAKRIMALSPKKCVILCGSGNNGGDGFVIARELLANNIETKVILAKGQPKSDIAQHYYSELPKDIIFDLSGNIKEIISQCDTVVECVFGTGFHGELPENVAELFDMANKVKQRVAVDIPGGMDSDTGAFDERCFKPTLTIVIASMKVGLINPACVNILGKIELADIGITEDCYSEYTAILSDDSMRSAFPKRLPASHKGTFGKLLNIAGSAFCCGAAAMSTKAALRTGVGLCTLAAPLSVVRTLASGIYETTYLPLPETPEGIIGENSPEKIAPALEKSNAVSIGCGLSDSENTRLLTEYIIKNAACPVIIDADGINSISRNINVLKNRTSTVILTPHPLEFSRISGLSVKEIQQDRISAAKSFAAEYGVIVLLKGVFTVITDGITTYVNPTGNAGLSKGGSGDVLTGIIGSLLAQGVEPLTAAAAGAYCHGYAADSLAKKMPMTCMLASDLIEELRYTVAE